VDVKASSESQNDLNSRAFLYSNSRDVFGITNEVATAI
jgi:hypothetical protein